MYSLVFAPQPSSAQPQTKPQSHANPPEEEGSKEILPGGGVKKFYQGVVKKFNPQYTGRQKKEISNIRLVESEGKTGDTGEALPLSEQVYRENTVTLTEPEGEFEREHLDQSQYLIPSHTVSSEPVRHPPSVRPPVAQTSEEATNVRDALLGPVSQFAEEFHDRATLKISLSRAEHLATRSHKRSTHLLA